jgi:flagellar motility protein MotE (MotC chaperone)
MRFHFLPIAIFAAVLMLGVKMGNIWFGFEGPGVTPSHAQEAKKPAIPAKDKKPSRPPAAGNVKKDPVAGADGAAKKGKGDKAASENGAPSKPRGLPSDPTLFTQAEVDLLQKLAGRHAELERWARDLTMREQLLKATEKRVEKKMTELGAIQDKVKSMLRQYDKEQEGRLKSMVKIYQSMKPKDAARIFMELEMPILLDVVERMREAKAAAILAKMEPGKAKRVTARIVVRRKFRGDRAGRLLTASPKAAAPPTAAN